MDYVNLYTAVAATIMASIAIIIYYCRSGSRLEERLNRIIKEKSPLVSGGIQRSIRGYIQRFSN